MRALGFACLLAVTATAAADPITIRLATAAPEGSGWWRILRRMSDEVDTQTKGEVRVKWYFGGITGSETETLSRITRGQLDGIGSGGVACERTIPSIKVTRMFSVFQTRDEASYVARKLSGTFSDEARDSGFFLLGVGGMGADVIFANHPIKTFAELQKARLWRWDLDETANKFARSIGLSVVERPVEDARPSFDRGELDGFVAVPTAALAFQWTTRARYVTKLPIGYLFGCIIMANRTYDKLTPEQQQILRSTAAETVLRWEEFGAETDAALLGPLAQKQGLIVSQPSESFRSELFRLSADSRNRTAWVPAPLLDRVMRLLADYRAEHGVSAR